MRGESSQVYRELLDERLDTVPSRLSSTSIAPYHDAFTRTASRIHIAKILRLSEDLPTVIEIVDTEAKIDALLPFLDEMVGGGLVTIEKIRVLKIQPHGT